MWIKFDSNGVVASMLVGLWPAWKSVPLAACGIFEDLRLNEGRKKIMKFRKIYYLIDIITLY